MVKFKLLLEGIGFDDKEGGGELDYKSEFGRGRINVRSDEMKVLCRDG